MATREWIKVYLAVILFLGILAISLQSYAFAQGIKPDCRELYAFSKNYGASKVASLIGQAYFFEKDADAFEKSSPNLIKEAIDHKIKLDNLDKDESYRNILIQEYAFAVTLFNETGQLCQSENGKTEIKSFSQVQNQLMRALFKDDEPSAATGSSPVSARF